MERLQMNKMRKGKRYEFCKTTDGYIFYADVEETNDKFVLGEPCRPCEINSYLVKGSTIKLTNGYRLEKVEITLLDVIECKFWFTAILRKD